jgi:hypothetical protein
MNENFRLHLFTLVLADIMQNPHEVEQIVAGLKEGYPELAQELLDKPL